MFARTGIWALLAAAASRSGLTRGRPVSEATDTTSTGWLRSGSLSRSSNDRTAAAVTVRTAAGTGSVSAGAGA